MDPTPSSPVISGTSSSTNDQQAAGTVDSLDQLQTPQQVQLLDKIDELRSQGLGHHGISLPQLIVCGEQSSGKSSLLEGLTRLRFPTKGGKTCTTFTTEVVLRKEPEVEIVCTIIPGAGRPAAERRKLAEFKETFTSRGNFKFAEVVEKAKLKMALDNPDPQLLESIYFDVLRVRYSGPDLPSLTVVDLPGLIEIQKDGGDGVQKVEALVTSYMRDPKSIILAVVQASDDLSNRKVFPRLKEFDSTSSRTLGIITKPDSVDRGSDAEKEVIKLAKNEWYWLKHGWHAVRNRSFTTREQTDAERDETERQFFSSGLWASVTRNDVGITTLRAKLSRMLLEHIGKELPSLVTAVQEAIESTSTSLRALGDTRETIQQQRVYLTSHATQFHTLTQNALRGEYNDPFFDVSSDNTTSSLLRTRIENLNLSFANIMYCKGHTWEIEDKLSANTRTSITSYPDVDEYPEYLNEPTHVDRARFLEKNIGLYVRKTRQTSIPTLFNPIVIGLVFREQSKGWKDIALYHLKRVFQAVQEYLDEVLGSIMDERTRRMLMLEHIQQELDLRWRRVEEKLDELLLPYTQTMPAAYDPTFRRELDEMKIARSQERNATPHMFGQNNHGQQSTFFGGPPKAEPPVDLTNSEILDLVQGYYRVSPVPMLLTFYMLTRLQRALEVFVSNVAMLAIENCLIKDLSATFDPNLVVEMSDEKLANIASESEETRIQRTELRQRLAVLEGGKQVLKDHMGKLASTCHMSTRSLTVN